MTTNLGVRDHFDTIDFDNGDLHHVVRSCKAEDVTVDLCLHLDSSIKQTTNSTTHCYISLKFHHTHPDTTGVFSQDRWTLEKTFPVTSR